MNGVNRLQVIVCNFRSLISVLHHLLSLLLHLFIKLLLMVLLAPKYFRAEHLSVGEYSCFLASLLSDDEKRHLTLEHKNIS